MGVLNQLVFMAWHSLLRGRAQTLLAVLGVAVGVGALVASIALGRGAQESLKDQLLAAGSNVIVITAGNYQVAKPENNEGPAGHEGAALYRPFDPFRDVGYGSDIPGVRLPSREGFVRTHFEDDPNAVHDHPTAKDRLGDSMAGLGSAATLTRADAEAIRKEIPGIQYVAAGVHDNARITVDGPGAKNWLTRFHGTEAHLPEIRRGWTFPKGHFLSQKDVDDAAQVMVLGKVVADKLFGENINPVGKPVLLWKQRFTVIGVVSSKSWADQPAPGDDQFDAVYVPVSTIHKLLNLSKLNTITVTTASAGDTTKIAKQLVTLLRKRHGIANQMADDFTVRTQAQQLLGKGLPPDVARVVAGNMLSVDKLTFEQLSNSLMRSNRTMMGLLAGVAMVSLLVGGVGVMNLLLLSVTQRTREVGLRMALGAHAGDVALQFLLEAILLSLVGGVLGAAVGFVAAKALQEFFGWQAYVSSLSIALAMIVAILLGATSGAYPARRAAQLDPIVSLRHE
jgi:putative ABC transport system permease protein